MQHGAIFCHAGLLLQQLMLTLFMPSTCMWRHNLPGCEPLHTPTMAVASFCNATPTNEFERDIQWALLPPGMMSGPTS
jgi:hypothetical protein